MVHPDRAEVLRTVFDCVILRAVEKMPQAVAAAVKLVAPDGWLALMTTDPHFPDLGRAAGEQFRWDQPVRLPGSESPAFSPWRKVGSASLISTSFRTDCRSPGLPIMSRTPVPSA